MTDQELKELIDRIWQPESPEDRDEAVEKIVLEFGRLKGRLSAMASEKVQCNHCGRVNTVRCVRCRRIVG
jgi:hypothetical protein